MVEAYAGTNAIGTAVAVGQPVQIHSAEHFCGHQALDLLGHGAAPPARW